MTQSHGSNVRMDDDCQAAKTDTTRRFSFPSDVLNPCAKPFRAQGLFSFKMAGRDEYEVQGKIRFIYLVVYIAAVFLFYMDGRDEF